MLWYKGWLETRLRVLLALGWIGWFLGSEYSRGIQTPEGLIVPAGSAMLIGTVLPVIFAGAGIVTQPAFRRAKGSHRSTLFTLALPVSKLRLLAIRAGLGWLELVGVLFLMCCGMWAMIPIVRASATPVELFEYAVALVACASAFYSTSLLLGAFLDDLWRMWVSLMVLGALWLLSYRAPFPVSMNIFRAIGDRSPILAHTMPWSAMCVALVLAAILFFAALKIVQAREY